MQVWLVYGMSGEYDDAREAVLAAFDSEAKAEAFAKEKRELLDNLRMHEDGDHSRAGEVGYRFRYDIEVQLGSIPMSPTGASIVVGYPIDVQ